MNNFNLLNLDISYSLEYLKKTGSENILEQKTLNNFFNHVWTIHPFASLVTSPDWSNKYGPYNIYKISPNCTFIEGKIGRFKFLKFFDKINFFLSQLCIFFSLIKLIKKENINFIKSSDILYCGIFGLFLSFITKKKLVVRVGSNNDKIYETTGKPLQKKIFFFRGIEKIIENLVLKKADFVIGANHDNIEFAIKNGSDIKKTKVIRYGSIINDFHFSNPLNRSIDYKFFEKNKLETKKFILYIGRLETVKHPEDVIYVLKEISKKDEHMKAILIGDGSLKKNLEELASKLSITEKVILTGNMNQKFISEIIPHSLIIISPHTGRALSEAALGGGVIIGYDIDWQREIIKNNITGRLVPYRNLESLKKIAIETIYNTNDLIKFSNNVRIEALKLMDKKKLDKEEREVYLKLL